MDARRFGVLVVYPREAGSRSPELSVLGPDPLSDAFTVEYLRAQAAGSRRDVKQFLLPRPSVIAAAFNVAVM